MAAGIVQVEGMEPDLDFNPNRYNPDDEMSAVEMEGAMAAFGGMFDALRDEHPEWPDDYIFRYMMKNHEGFNGLYIRQPSFCELLCSSEACSRETLKEMCQLLQATEDGRISREQGDDIAVANVTGEVGYGPSEDEVMEVSRILELIATEYGGSADAFMLAMSDQREARLVKENDAEK